MKNFTILILMLLYSCSGVEKSTNTEKDKSQQTIAAPLIGLDSLKYLKSVVEEKNKYVHKDFNVLLNDLKIPPKSFMFGMVANNIKISNDLTLQFMGYQKAANDVRRPFRERPLLFVEWQKPASLDSCTYLFRKGHGEWTPEVNAYFGKLEVKDIFVQRGN